MTIEKTMTEMRKFRAERQVADALNTRNDLIITSIHDLPLNSNVLIWRESKKWTEPFKLLSMNDETCKIELLSEPIDFRSTVIKPFLIEPSMNDVQSTNENVQPTDSSDDENQNPAPEILTRPTHPSKTFTTKISEFCWYHCISARRRWFVTTYFHPDFCWVKTKRNKRFVEASDFWTDHHFEDV
jgi:hypothetical protein